MQPNIRVTEEQLQKNARRVSDFIEQHDIHQFIDDTYDINYGLNGGDEYVYTQVKDYHVRRLYEGRCAKYRRRRR